MNSMLLCTYCMYVDDTCVPSNMSYCVYIPVDPPQCPLTLTVAPYLKNGMGKISRLGYV